MNPVKRFLPAYTSLAENQAAELSQPSGEWYTVAVRPSKNANHQATLEGFVKGIQELQTSWIGIRNTSPVTAFEIRRLSPDTLRLQFSAPTKRLERKIRTELTNQLPDIELREGVDTLPVSESDTVGGGLLTVGRRDWYPLQTEFDQPPTNSLIATLHRHAMKRTGILVQVLFKPVIGDPVRRWWRNRRTYQRIGYLRKQKEQLWHSRPPTPREKQQADAIERKAGTTRFHVSIRFLLVNSREYTPSRVKELAGGFNTYENPDTGQYLNAVTVQTLPSRVFDFAMTVVQRRFGNWHRRFQASASELAALVSIPDRTQQNLRTATP